jgi:hypothetical protein
MATYEKVKLSGSTNGRGIPVAGTATASADVIHTAGATALDEVWLYAQNISSTASKLTLEWGSATAIGDNIEITIPAESGLTLVIPGLLLTGSLDVQAFADVTNVINIFGYVNRIT